MTDQTTPAAPLTLADMSRAERRACQWMQADVTNHSVRYVILEPHDPRGSVVTVSPSGRVVWFRPHRVTPRPDLPRLTWPAGDQEADQ